MTDEEKGILDRIDRKTLAALLIIDLVIVVGLVAWVNIEGARQRDALNEAAAAVKYECITCLAMLPPWSRYQFPANETACPVCNMTRAIAEYPTPKVFV